jgi:gluconolactonase
MTNITGPFDWRVIATGLAFPEGPVALPDGGLAFVEVRGGAVSEIDASGTLRQIARPGGGPNGLALGPGGSYYLCNNGGFSWGERRPFLQPPDYAGGRIERVHSASGRVELLYETCNNRRLKAPNDLVFDAFGGFYFTDSGKSRERERDFGAVYYALADGSSITEAAFPMISPNGIGLSPDGKVLYVTETETGRLWAFDILSPGEFAKIPRTQHGGRLVAGLPGYQKFDGMAVDEEGLIYVATIETGAITVISPAGKILAQIDVGDPDVTNICFGGPGRRTVYVTLGGKGEVIASSFGRQGMRLAY